MIRHFPLIFWLTLAAAVHALPAGAAAQQHRYFKLQVLDPSGAPLPCARLLTTAQTEYHSDRNGWVAFYEPGLMGQRVYFAPSLAGYKFASNLFGFTGTTFTVNEGGSASIIAESVAGSPGTCVIGDEDTQLLQTGLVPTPAEHFRIQFIDAQSGRPLPLVMLQGPRRSQYSDNNGLIAFYERDSMGKAVSFDIESHGYALTSGSNSVTLTTTPGQAVEVSLTAKAGQLAQRLYRVTGSGAYRESALLGVSAPIAQPQLNAFVTGQDSSQTVVYNNKLYWVWGDTNFLGRPLGNFKGTMATSALPATGGLDPAQGVDLQYSVRQTGWPQEIGLPREVAPPSSVPNPADYTAFLPTWINSLAVVPNGQGQPRLIARYGMFTGDLIEKERGLIRFNDSLGVFEKVLVLTNANRAQPEGHPYTLRHGTEDYVYYHNTVRVPASEAALLNPNTYEAYTPFVAGSQTEIERVGGLPVYAWKQNTPLAESMVGVGKGLALYESERLFGKYREPSSGYRPTIASGSTAWNAHRGRFVQVLQEKDYGWEKRTPTTSLLGELWYAEGDTPMGPWVYTRKIVTHDNYSFYNPHQHPYFDKNGGQEIYFEASYTKIFTNAEPTPYHDYNQVMYSLDLADARLSLPVPVYDLTTSAPGRFAVKSGIRRTNSDVPAAFFAFDRPVVGAVPVYWSTAGCRGGVLKAGGTATTEPLFYALAAGALNPPAETTPLYEYQNGLQRAYSTQTTLSGYTRLGELARVWRNPLSVALPVTQYLPDLVADAGDDQCVTQAEPDQNVSVTLDARRSSDTNAQITTYAWSWGSAGTASGATPTVQLPPGMHNIALATTDSTGRTSRDTLIVDVAANDDGDATPQGEGTCDRDPRKTTADAALTERVIRTWMIRHLPFASAGQLGYKSNSDGSAYPFRSEDRARSLRDDAHCRHQGARYWACVGSRWPVLARGDRPR